MNLLLIRYYNGLKVGAKFVLSMQRKYMSIY